MSERLSGRVALVTGAGSGIGAASAAALAHAGAAVLVTDVDERAAESVAADLRAEDLRARALRLDVASEEDWVAAVAAAEAIFGPVTVLHSNAALTSPAAYAADLGVVDLDLDLFDRIIAVNLRGGVLGCKHVVPGMLAAGGGSIILTSSVKGTTGSAHRTAYSVSKGGLDTLAKVVATGYGKGGVRCNAIAPGIVATEALTSVPAAQLAALEDAHLTPALGRPEDIANAVVFLASDDSAFITGQVLSVDGGLTAHTAALSPAGSRGHRVKVLLLGATGKVGAPVREELLARGHDVTAVVRDATRLPAAGAALHHLPGDVFDRAFLATAAAGVDVVVCSVALRDPGQRDRTPAALVRGVAEAAAAAGARLVALGGAGSLRTAAGPDLVDTPGFPEAARSESLGFREALHRLIDSAPDGLDWTVVSPPVSIEEQGPRTGTYRTADDDLLVDAAGASRISAADLAVAVVDEVETGAHPRRRVAVGY